MEEKFNLAQTKKKNKNRKNRKAKERKQKEVKAMAKCCTCERKTRTYKILSDSKKIFTHSDMSEIYTHWCYVYMYLNVCSNREGKK